MIVKLRTVVIIPESFITKGSSKQPEPINVLTITKIVRLEEFLGTEKIN